MKTVKTDTSCSLQEIMTLLSKRHMLSTIYSLSMGEKGFNDLQGELSVNTATLAKRLKELVAAELVSVQCCTKDTRVRYYRLTRRGKSLSKRIENLGNV